MLHSRDSELCVMMMGGITYTDIMCSIMDEETFPPQQ